MRPALITSSLVAFAAAACGAPISSSPGATGCPSATAVALAVWHEGARVGQTGSYHVPIGYRAAETPDTPAPGAVPTFVMARLGLGPLPPTVWLLRPGVAPCSTQIAGYVAERRVDRDGAIGVELAAVLDDACGAPEDAAAPAWVSLVGAEPAGCRLVAPTRLDARVASFDGEAFALPEPAPLPEAWAAVAPEVCDAPCERLWSIDEIAGAPALHEVVVTELESNLDACAVVPVDRGGVFATAADGAPIAIPTPLGIGLDGALVDDRGTRVVLGRSASQWLAIDLGPDGQPGPRREVTITSGADQLARSHAPACW